MTNELPAAYQLKISLADSTPEIWRRVLVPSAMTLADLHHMIQQAMGWASVHDYQFSSGLAPQKVAYSPEQDFAAVMGTIEADALRYLYDFESGWLHRVEIEALEVDADDSAALQLPVCLGGEEACPPEGTGGMWGYEEFLDRLDDPEDPEYLDLIERYGDFDPGAFDPDEATKRLRCLLK